MGARYRTHLTPRVGRGQRVQHVRRKPYSTSPVAFAMTNSTAAGRACDDGSWCRRCSRSDRYQDDLIRK